MQARMIDEKSNRVTLSFKKSYRALNAWSELLGTSGKRKYFRNLETPISVEHSTSYTGLEKG